MEEMREDEQVNQRGMVPQVTLPLCENKTVQQLGCPINLSACPPEYRHAGYPDGYHTKEILAELGYSEAEIAELST